MKERGARTLVSASEGVGCQGMSRDVKAGVDASEPGKPLKSGFLSYGNLMEVTLSSYSSDVIF